MSSARRDYKPPIQTPRKSRQYRRVRVLGWAVVVMSLGGAGAAGVAWWRNHHAATVAAAPPAGPLPAAGYLATSGGGKPVEDARSVRKTTPPPIEVPKSRFDFYNVLKDRQVTIPQDEIGGRGPRPPVADSTVAITTILSGTGTQPATGGASKPATAPTPPAQPAAARGYLVQAGAFPSAAQADAVRARLALHGVSSRVEAGRLPDGTPVHRVRLGPFKDEAAARQVQQKLTGVGVPSIALKVD